jgi:hypothetical protein
MEKLPVIRNWYDFNEGTLSRQTLTKSKKRITKPRYWHRSDLLPFLFISIKKKLMDVISGLTPAAGS